MSDKTETNESRIKRVYDIDRVIFSVQILVQEYFRYETYLIPGEKLIPGERGEAFHPGIGYASYLEYLKGSYV